MDNDGEVVASTKHNLQSGQFVQIECGEKIEGSYWVASRIIIIGEEPQEGVTNDRSQKKSSSKGYSPSKPTGSQPVLKDGVWTN